MRASRARRISRRTWRAVHRRETPRLWRRDWPCRTATAPPASTSPRPSRRDELRRPEQSRSRGSPPSRPSPQLDDAGPPARGPYSKWHRFEQEHALGEAAQLEVALARRMIVEQQDGTRMPREEVLEPEDRAPVPQRIAREGEVPRRSPDRVTYKPRSPFRRPSSRNCSAIGLASSRLAFDQMHPIARQSTVEEQIEAWDAG